MICSKPSSQTGFWAPRLVGTTDQAARFETEWTKSCSFLGGAVNPRDSDLAAVPNDEGTLTFNGKKSFSTGSKVSDVTILEGVLPDGKTHIFAPVSSKQAGIVYKDDWVDVLGMRGTQSGGVTITNVQVPWDDALGLCCSLSKLS